MVQKAFHARATEWSGCTDLHWKDAPDSSVHDADHKMVSGASAAGVAVNFWASHFRIAIYTSANCRVVTGEHVVSGDFDAICPFTATRHGTPSLTLELSIGHGAMAPVDSKQKSWRLCSAVHGRSCDCFS